MLLLGNDQILFGLFQYEVGVVEMKLFLVDGVLECLALKLDNQIALFDDGAFLNHALDDHGPP